MKALFVILFTVSFLIVFGQDTSDVYRLKNMPYMNKASKVNCKNTNRSIIEKKICLSIEFQAIDSMLNAKISILLPTFSDSAKTMFLADHEHWLKTRRSSSYAQVQNMDGSDFGLYYLANMILVTERKVGKLEDQIWNLD